MSTRTLTAEALAEAENVASQCRATATSPLAHSMLVDGGSGFLTELLTDAARVIETTSAALQARSAAPSGLKRWYMRAGDGPGVYPEQEPDGEWVRFDDVAALAMGTHHEQLLRQLAACSHGDPNRRKSTAGRWTTVNVPTGLWNKVSTVSEGPAADYVAISSPDYNKMMVDALTTGTGVLETALVRGEIGSVNGGHAFVPADTDAETRYHVDKSESGFWPYVVRAGNGKRVLYRGHRKSCNQVASELKTAFLDGRFIGTVGAPEPATGEAEAALAELVCCKALKEQIEEAVRQSRQSTRPPADRQADAMALQRLEEEYRRRQPAAWARARALLNGERGNG